jgi:hypothetical protein
MPPIYSAIVRLNNAISIWCECGSKLQRWQTCRTQIAPIEFRSHILMSNARPVSYPLRQPTKAQTRLWKRFITSSYLRYIPCWKIPPATQQPAEPVATIEPINLSDYGEYIATCLTRTEQRLLDGLVQVATDLKIWRAFRSKARLHLASDGGLGDNSATHGWLLSTGKEVLFQCSGPVDGPLDTNSLTRSALGGCASSLLLLSSLSTFWGIRHRCSFRWNIDSASAISRFHKFCGHSQRSTRMPPDSDLLSIIASCRRQLKRPFTPHWV